MINKYLSTPNPASRYSEAIERIASLRLEAQNDILPVCQSKVMTHGGQTEHVVVLLHGLTNCPEQFNLLGSRLFKLGYNVFIPLLPHHGLAERMTKELKNIRASELTEFADRVIDIAHGLGNHVTVCGFSAGGTMTCWLAQNRPDLYLAIPISAMLGISFVPILFTRAISSALQFMPDFYVWWDPRVKEKIINSNYYGYPGFPIHALSELWKIGISIRQQAEKHPSAVKEIIMIMNDHEPAVNNAENKKLLADWRANGNLELDEFHFDAKLKLPHDIITPGTPGLDIDIVYDALIRIIHSALRSPIT